jgi:hypothetical protein
MALFKENIFEETPLMKILFGFLIISNLISPAQKDINRPSLLGLISKWPVVSAAKKGCFPEHKLPKPLRRLFPIASEIIKVHFEGGLSSFLTSKQQ